MATLDILTEAEAQRAALNADSTGHETEIARLNTAVSLRIDELCGPVVKRSVTEYHDGGDAEIYPRMTPVAAVTTLKEWDGSSLTTLTGDTWGTAGAAEGYWLDQSSTYAHDCRIVRRSTGDPAVFLRGTDSIQLVYSAGRYDDTESVDARFKECAAEIIRSIWDREAAAWSRGADPLQYDGMNVGRGHYNAIDRRIAELLGDEMRPPGVG